MQFTITASENHATTIARETGDQQRYARLKQLGDQLAGMMNPDAILPAIVNTVGETLHVPYAAVCIRRSDTDEDEVAAQYVADDAQQTPANELDPDSVTDDLTPASHLLSVPLSYHGELVGTLLVRTHDESPDLNEEEVALLNEFGRRAGASVRIVRLMHDLSRVRERLVVAREEERQRLRRNLHDGIGPTLASLNMRLATVRKMIGQKPQVAEAQMGEFAEQLRAVITEIRRVVYNLRPPALDVLGMLPAIREQARQFSAEDFEVIVEAPDELPPLHAAVEVGAYRIVSEALANVARHAQAHHCRIRLAVDERTFFIEVQDDGLGIPVGKPAGVGLHSMRERATELGGTCSLESTPTTGTTVRARLPIHLDAWTEPETLDSMPGVEVDRTAEGRT